MKCTTGEIISVGNGSLCCPIDRVYTMLNFLTGDNLFTHVLPRAFRACRNHVETQFPWLLELPEINRDNWEAVVNDVTAKYGNEHELIALPKGSWQSVDPIQEAIELMEGRDKIIVVNT